MQEDINRLLEIIGEEKIIIARLEEKIKDAGNSGYANLMLSALDFTDPMLGTRIVNACHSAHIHTVQELLRYSPRDVIRFRNSGRKSVEILQQTLKEKYGIEWK